MATEKLTTYATREELEKAVIRRARAVMGMRGLRNATTISVCTNALRKLGGLSHTDDKLASVAREIAEDTIFHDYG